jgi:hypothetical protein
MPANPMTIFDAARSAGAREVMETALGTEGLREKGAEILARSVFCARGSNAIFVSDLKTIIDRLTQGDIGEGQARTAIWESLRALGYTPEGGFPDTPPGEVPPAVAGTLQDLSSFRRRDLIVRTQLDLMRGAGQQTRGHTPDHLQLWPAWELVRVEDKKTPRDWPSRWTVAGGKPGPMIALKADPVWGELGSYDNFQDALGVDHPPFAFDSGMGWREVSADECASLGITGPKGEAPEQWLQSGPVVMAGKLPLPSPQISLKGVDPAIIARFRAATGATVNPAKPAVLDYSDILERELAAAAKSYAAKP